MLSVVPVGWLVPVMLDCVVKLLVWLGIVLSEVLEASWEPLV